MLNPIDLQNVIPACSVCIGNAASPMTRGLNFGIAALLVMVAVTLGLFGSFFWQIRQRNEEIGPQTADDRPQS